MRILTVTFMVLALQGCIYTQTGFIRNDTDRTVFVGNPGGSSYRKISGRQAVETEFVYCLEVASYEVTRYYGVPQVSGGEYFGEGPTSRADAPSSVVPADAYRKGGPLYDVALGYTNDGLFFDSATQGLVPVPESKRCSESDSEVAN